MPEQLLDDRISQFDRDLHVQARTVLGRTPQPQNLFEVAVVLETEGYDQEAVRALGSSDIFDLARRVYDVLDLYAAPSSAGAELPAAHEGTRDAPRRISVGLLARCVLYSLPWLVAIAALVLSRVSFWSTITTVQISSAISVALFVALVVTGAFIQAFARRGTFYALQGNRPLLAWATRWTLGGAVLAAVVVNVGLYALLEYGVRAYTPASTLVFLGFGLSISAMLLSLAPLYMTRSFAAIALAAGTGGLFVVIAGKAITYGDYINPYTAVHVQLIAIWVVVAIATAFDVRALRRAPIRLDQPEIERVRPPRLSAAAHSVTGYALYGSFFFALIIVDQLVAGGIWQGRFVYNGQYELATGLGLLVLVPTLTYVAAVNEIFAGVVGDAFAGHAVDEAASLRADMLGFYRRHLGILVVAGLCSAGLLLLAGWEAAGATTVTTGLSHAYGLFAGAVLAYLLLAVGALNAGLLFSLGRPSAPAAATVAGASASALVGGLLATLWQSEAGALVGLAVGTAIFAVWTTATARRVFARFDASYYRAF